MRSARRSRLRGTYDLLEMRLAEEGVVDLHRGCTDFRHDGGRGSKVCAEGDGDWRERARLQGMWVVGEAWVVGVPEVI